jgi:hypothetical protein
LFDPLDVHRSRERLGIVVRHEADAPVGIEPADDPRDQKTHATIGVVDDDAAREAGRPTALQSFPIFTAEEQRRVEHHHEREQPEVADCLEPAVESDDEQRRDAAARADPDRREEQGRDRRFDDERADREPEDARRR